VTVEVTVDDVVYVTLNCWEAMPAAGENTPKDPTEPDAVIVKALEKANTAAGLPLTRARGTRLTVTAVLSSTAPDGVHVITEDVGTAVTVSEADPPATPVESVTTRDKLGAV